MVNWITKLKRQIGNISALCYALKSVCFRLERSENQRQNEDIYSLFFTIAAFLHSTWIGANRPHIADHRNCFDFELRVHRQLPHLDGTARRGIRGKNCKNSKTQLKLFTSFPSNNYTYTRTSRKQWVHYLNRTLRNKL